MAEMVKDGGFKSDIKPSDHGLTSKNDKNNKLSR
jgi:hypothetical protein